MRPNLRNAVLAAGALLLCASGTARAGESIVLRADVPFAFVVRGQIFPAGKYVVERDDLSPSLLLIRSEGSKHPVAFVETIRHAGKDPAGSHAALTFTRHANEYRLAGIWESQGQGWDVLSPVHHAG
jgi:hypothetical protein